ncbi:MAG: hypothetical protein V1772_06045 [Chloroflexota bacterium]
MNARGIGGWWKRLWAGRGTALALVWLCGLAIGALVMAPANGGRGAVEAEVALLTQPRPSATPADPCAQMDAFMVEFTPLQAERAEVVHVMGNYGEHMRGFPDRMRSHALSILNYAWSHLEEHRAHVAELTVPVECAEAMALYDESLEALADGVESHALYYDPNEGGETMREVGDMYIEIAERHRDECEQLLSALLSRCGPVRE